jgi:hypothetical protein
VSNSIQTLTFITREMLRQVKNNLQFVRNCSGEEFAGRFTETPKKGETIKIRKPARYIGRDGETFTEEAYIERSVEMTVQETAGVDLLLTNRELMFSLDEIAERVIAPAALTLANKIDRAALLIATQATANYVGVPGTVPTALKTYNQARALMSWEAAPPDNHALLITPDMHVEAVDAGKALFNPTGDIGRQYETGLIGRHAGAKVYECQTMITHTVGPLGGTPAVDGADQKASTATQTSMNLNTKDWTNAAAARMKKGDVIEIAGVYAVNPLTRQSTGGLRKFVVTADFSSAADGTGALAIAPAIVTSGPYQNCSAAPADGALISVFAKAAANQADIASKASPQGFRFHRDAFLFGSFDQPTPQGVEFCKMMSDSQTGLKLRLIRDWDTKANKEINRVDVVWAFGVAYPEWAARIAS